MSEKIQKLTSDLSRIMNSNQYKVEIDTEDMVLGFKETLTKRTKNLAKWLKLQIKTRQDLGRYISDTVRIMEVRWYKNGQLIRTLQAAQQTNL